MTEPDRAPQPVPYDDAVQAGEALKSAVEGIRRGVQPNRADDLAELDHWCAKRAATIGEKASQYMAAGGSIRDPEYRQLIGQSQAYHAVRSFIHGLKQGSAR